MQVVGTLEEVAAYGCYRMKVPPLVDVRAPVRHHKLANGRKIRILNIDIEEIFGLRVSIKSMCFFYRTIMKIHHENVWIELRGRSACAGVSWE